VLHVPFLLSDGTSGEPDETNGESDDLVGLLDLAPTLVDCADLVQPDAFEGSSLLDDDQERSEVIAEWADTDLASDARRYAIRSEDWKYVRMDDGTERLFVLQSDPGERNNVVDTMPEVADDFRARLQDHRELLGATNRDLGDVTMEEDVAERLRLLGYQE